MTRKTLLQIILSSAVAAIWPAVSPAQIIWSGNFENACPFTQWHSESDNDSPHFWGMPAYGRPQAPNPNCTSVGESYFGNGDLLTLVTKPVREGTHAARFTVKNSANGSEPADCDAGNCDQRRSELHMHTIMPDHYKAMNQYEEYWFSTSYFVPTDWDDSGSGWGVLVFQVKPKIQGGGIGPTFNIEIDRGRWNVRHAWTDIEDCQCKLPWQQVMDYHASGTNAALLDDFPDRAASEAALADLNKGGWTDWIVNVKWDHRGSITGGKGFLNVWKRSGSDEWVHVLNIKPKLIALGGLTFDRGIGQNASGGFGPLTGMYMSKSQVWGLANNRVLYVDNVRVGNGTASFADMSPDRSSPGAKLAPEESPPRPPQIIN